MVCPLGRAAELGWDFYLTCFIMLIPPLLVGAGLLHGLLLLRKPEANRKCALSFLAAIVAWGMLAGGLLLTYLLTVGRPREGSNLPTLIALFASIPGVAGLMLGIIGLAEVRGSPDRYSRGRRTGVIAIILTVLLIAVIGLMMVLIHGRALSNSRVLGAARMDPGRRTIMRADRARASPAVARFEARALPARSMTPARCDRH